MSDSVGMYPDRKTEYFESKRESSLEKSQNMTDSFHDKTNTHSELRK